MPRPRVGDVVLSVNGEDLNGAKLLEVLAKTPCSTYELYVARSTGGANLFGGGGGESEYEGWLFVEASRQGHAINVLSRSRRKCWVCLKGAAIFVYDGAKRAGAPQRYPAIPYMYIIPGGWTLLPHPKCATTPTPRR